MLARALAVALVGCGSQASEPEYPDAPYAPAVQTGTLTDPDLEEASGMVATGDGLWVVSDSGNLPRLVRIGLDGAVRGRFDLDGAENVDWETLTSFQRDGRTFLVVGDTGDNQAVRDHVVLYVVEEPDPAVGLERIPVAWTVRYRFPDGARDTEALAADGDQILLVTKRTAPPEVWTVPLAPTTDPVVATRLGVVPNLPSRTWGDVFARTHPAWPTDLAIAPDGTLAVLLTYAAAYAWTRTPGEDWAVVFGRPPARLAIPEMPQQEALCLGPDGRTVWVTTEGGDAPLYRLDPLLPGPP